MTTTDGATLLLEHRAVRVFRLVLVIAFVAVGAAFVAQSEVLVKLLGGVQFAAAAGLLLHPIAPGAGLSLCALQVEGRSNLGAVYAVKLGDVRVVEHRSLLGGTVVRFAGARSRRSHSVMFLEPESGETVLDAARSCDHVRLAHGPRIPLVDR